MRIVIDMQGAQTESRFRGIGRYSLSLALAMARHAGPHEIWLVVNARFPDSIPAIRVAFDGLIPASRIRSFDVPVSRQQGDWLGLASEVVREDFIASLAPDVVLLTSVFEGYHSAATTSIGAHALGIPTAAVLYDLIPLLNQEQYLTSSDMREHYFRKIEWMKKADLLLAISESSRQEGIRHLGRTAEEVVNISTAVGPQFQQRKLSAEAQSGLCTRLGIVRKMVMYAPGGFDPRKNFARLIEAYSRLPENLRAQHQLVIVSKLNPPQRQELNDLRVRHGLRSDELVLPGYVGDDDLITLYSIAVLFVFPSLHEGFGLPVLEAMACGAIVIGSSGTSVPEVIGLEAALFDPMSVDSICEKLTQALTDDGFRQNLHFHAQQQAKKFTWDYSALQAIRALESLHARTDQHQASIVIRSPVISTLAALGRSVKPSDSALRTTAQCLAFNCGPDRPQLLLDISALVQSDAKSGIQRVVRSLLAELLNNPPPGFNVQPIYFDGNDYRYARRFSASITAKFAAGADTVADFWQDDLYLSLDLIMHLTPQVHDLHKDLAARGLKLYFIVYDILLAQHPEWWPEGTDTQFNSWLNCISEVATGLVCISRAVADDVIAWLRANPPRRAELGPRVGSFHLGADVENSLPSRGMPESATKVLECIAVRKSFLMVSTIEPRKGYAQALAAFELLWKLGHDINLIIVGKRGWLVDELTRRIAMHAENGRRLFWLEGISDQYLERLYQDSHCLIAASEGEGFGLPLIEAAQHRLPIIARDIPVFREVAGDHALYFSGKGPEDLAGALRTWLSQSATDAHPKSTNIPWLTWKQSAENLLSEMSINSSEKSHASGLASSGAKL
jgi:glycosyltransferase involved in cell wall biosynthesis